MINWLSINYFLTTSLWVFVILAIIFTIRFLYYRTKLSLAFLVVVTTIILIIIWFIWDTYTYNLTCSIVKDKFSINGTEWQNYAGRCG